MGDICYCRLKPLAISKLPNKSDGHLETTSPVFNNQYFHNYFTLYNVNYY